MEFSVAMCVYKNDNPIYFAEALESVYNQTLKPSEVVLVVDGPIPDKIQLVVERYKSCNGLKVTYLSENVGHGEARRVGLERCIYDIVALMDADDISLPDRFETQVNAFRENPEVSIVGGQISEFIDSVKNIVGRRIVPESHEEIVEYIKNRCPFNQMTVMFRKSHVQAAGGYLDWHCNEDYYLWLRMYLDNREFMNTSKVLVHARVGVEMYKRRGGVEYFMSEAKLQKFMYDKKIIGLAKMIKNISIRLVVQVILPNSLRGWVFKTFARE